MMPYKLFTFLFIYLHTNLITELLFTYLLFVYYLI